MAEFAYNPIQLVEPGQNVLLNTVIPCNKGYVFHRESAGIVILRGIVNCPQACFARYQVTFNGNIALVEGADVGPISVALAIDGEPIQTSRAIITPAAVDEYGNVTCTCIVTIPRGCCFSMAVRYVSSVNDETVTPTPVINVSNSNLVISRVA